MSICLLLQVFRLGSSDTVRGHYQAWCDSEGNGKGMGDSGGDPFIEKKSPKEMDRCARRWQDPPKSSVAKGFASLVKEHQTRNGRRGGNGGAGWQSDVNRCQQGDVN